QVDGIGLLPIRMEGVALNGGVAIGRAVLHEPRIFITKVVGEDPNAELKRFGDSLHAVRADLDRMLEDGELGHGEHREVLETFRMFADDRGWVERIREGIGDGLTAEAAVQRAFDETRARFAEITDPYIRERLSDLSDLTNRLLLRLSGRNSAADPAQWPDEMIVVARDLGPADLLEYDRTKLRGLVLEEGSTLSHVAIVARALDIPVVGRVENILQRIEAGDAVVVDGDGAQVFVRPAEEIQQQIAETIGVREAQRQEYARLRGLPAQTRDSVAVSLRINAGLMIDLNHLDSTGADGVGLYRTEIPFMVRSEFPDVEAQTAIYARVLDMAAGRPVAFRTLDVGGDKVLPYVGAFDDENPAMGWRAIRIGLDRPAMLRGQLRAMIAAAGARPLQVMFPMIAEVAELRAARHLLDLELRRAKARAVPTPDRLSVGVMLEVPALIWQLDGLLGETDFVSIGTNDLLQFLFAADRGNPRLSGRYDCLSPAVLRALRLVVETCGKAGVEVSVCGEMAGRPVEALALLGIGVRTLSMSPGSVGAVKSMLRSLDLGHFAAFLGRQLSGSEHSLRDKIALYARDHGVRL
ncbi:MAG: phosphoenolpyruvate--protein phosphotransferase, partial [Alphaproteobacteria bacterium]|nr:phosphoenolpyruvate--protein phosphotransferase [Alphaproteobacteria bacterium]